MMRAAVLGSALAGGAAREVNAQQATTESYQVLLKDGSIAYGRLVRQDADSVVILGLILVLVGEQRNIRWLERADPIAALTVAGIVVWISLRLGKRTVDALARGGAWCRARHETGREPALSVAASSATVPVTVCTVAGWNG